MTLSTFQAIVLKSHETGNTSEVVHVICAEYGRLSVYAKGLRTPRSKARGALQPLSLVELTVHLREGGEMATLREAALLDDNAALVGDFERLCLGLVLAEAAAESCVPVQPAPELFAALLQALHDLDPRSGLDATAAACAGLATMLSVSGYEPTIDEALLRPWPAGVPKPERFLMDLESARVHAPGAKSGPGPRVPVPPAGVRFLYELGRGRHAELRGEDAAALLTALGALLEHYLQRGLRGLDFWRKTFGARP